MIKFKNFESWYITLGRKKIIIKSSDFELYFGRICAISGLNGSGKTTFLKSILGLSTFTNFDILYNNSKVSSGKTLNNMFSTGYAPEIMSDSFKIKVLDILKMINKIRVKKDDIDSPYSIYNIYSTLDLEEYKNVRFDKLSKGTKKRVLIAVAILNSPEIIILDEPFEGLDNLQRLRLKNILEELKYERLILISSHESFELESICNDFLKVENNKIFK